MRTHRRFEISGSVQGVGCRAQIEREVRKRWPAVTGYVRNLANGNVEVCAQGEAGELSEVEGLLRGGLRPPVRVTSVAVWEEAGTRRDLDPVSVAPNGFTVRY